MHEDALRQVLLVQAVEDEDLDGHLLPGAVRAEAARAAAREARDPQRLLAARAALLVPKLVARHPVLGSTLRLLRHVTGLHLAAMVLGAAAGVAFSALDGSRFVNILSLPLQALLLWNLMAIAFCIVAALRRRASMPAPLPLALAWSVERFGAWLARTPLARTARVDTRLAAILRRVAPAFLEAARPRLLASAAAALHLAAAALGAGLIAGLLVRGLVLDYRAGWESTFLEPAQVRPWLQVLYGAASAVLANPLPDATQLAVIRWRDGVGGEGAAPWLARMAVAVGIVVVAPRLILAALALARSARRRADAVMPASLDAAFARAFDGVDGAIPARKVAIAPYAYAPAYEAMERLRGGLQRALGATTELRVMEPVAHGEEDAFISRLGSGPAADLLVVLGTLASTPEADNHGRVISAARERGAVELALDEAPFAQRMAAAPERIAERRAAWERFAAEQAIRLRILRSDA